MTVAAQIKANPTTGQRIDAKSESKGSMTMATLAVSRPTTTSPDRLGLLAQIGLLAGPFLSMVDSNVVNVALPDIARALHSPLATAQWVVSGYLLALAAVLAASAYLAKRHGTRRVYRAALVGFTAASVLCALAPSIETLIALRALQGGLGAPLVPLAMNLLLGGRGAARRMPPTAGMLLFLAPALGPTLGGLLLPVAGWPAIFLINLPVGLLGYLGMWRVPADPADHGDPTVRFDPFGLVLLATGLTAALYGATEGPLEGWTADRVWPFLVGGAGLLTGYVAWAIRRPHPALDVKLLRRGRTALAVGLSSLAAVVMFVMLFLIPIFLQTVQGASPLTAGLTLLPQGLMTGVGTVLGEKLPGRVGLRSSVVVGMAILAASTAALLVVGATTPAAVTAAILIGRGLALGLTIQPLLHAMVGGLTSAEVADANTLFNVAQRLAGSVGISLLATFFQTREHWRVDEVLRGLGVAPNLLEQTPGNAVSASLGSVPLVVREQLAQAAVAGFHDTIWLLIVLAGLGLLASMALPARQAEQETTVDVS
jgi:EmrB/QacA subfamily drug resistance transporter